MRRWFSFYRGYGVAAVAAPLLMLVEVATQVLGPYLMRLVVNEGVLRRDVAAIQRYGFWMIALAVSGFIVGCLASYAGTHASQGFGANMRARVFAAIQSFSFENLDHFGTATLITRLSTDVSRLTVMARMVLLMAVRHPLILVMASVMALSINKDLTLIFAAALPCLAFILYVIARAAFSHVATLQRAIDRMNGFINEHLIALRDVKAFVREADTERAFSVCNDAVRDGALRVYRVITLAMPIMTLMLNASLILILWVGGAKVMAGQIPIGDVIGFLTYVGQVFMSLTMIVTLLIEGVRASSSARRCYEVIDQSAPLATPSDPVTSLATGAFAFDHVSFRYDGMVTQALDDVTLRVDAGMTVGVIGATGSSKSTLIHLLARVYDPQTGVVSIDGVDVRRYDRRTLRDRVSLVLQDDTLFSGTIRDNLLYGRKDADDQALWSALACADAAGFVAERDGQLDAVVEAHGGNFSGGQRQRLTIARALVRQPALLILDDAMSALDVATERHVRRALRALSGHPTVVLIAQRIATVEDADLIVVMNEGRIDGLGCHTDLLKTNALYREIFASQQQEVAS